MDLQLTEFDKGLTKNTVSVSDAIFAEKFNEPLIHQVITAYMATGRAGTKANKSRADVRGGGAKPWKQKGTGRARAGTKSSPIWRSGGVTFAARPRDYSQKVNKKMYRYALRSILSELIRRERLIVMNEILLDEPKTSKFVTLLKGLNLEQVLFITDSVDQNLFLAARNIPRVDIRDVVAVDPVSLVNFDKVVITVNALKQFEEQLA